MIKQSLLDGLKGLDVEVAIKRCSRNGLKSMPMKEGTISTMIARPKTVMLYYTEANNLITSAHAGDGLELLKGV
jgi:hypothetical protein